MNILIISNFNPYPIKDGASHRIWTIANLINKKKKNKVSVLFNADIKNKKKIRSINNIKLIQVPFLFNFMLKKRFWFQLNPLMLIEFLKLIKKTDIIQIEFPYLFPFALIAKLLKKKNILDQHGIEVIYQKDIHSNLNCILLNLIKFIEKIAISIANLVFVCSNYDKKKIVEIYKINVKKIKIIPNLIDFEEFKRIKSKGIKDSILFIGSKNHYPNKVAIRYIKNIIPSIKAKFIIVGDDKFRNLERKKVLSLIKSATICIAPIFQGSGTRIKILEYMANKKVVISTKKGAEGLNVTNEKNIIIINNCEEFKKKIVFLLKNKKERNKIAKNAYSLIKKRYNVRTYEKKINLIYHNL